MNRNQFFKKLFLFGALALLTKPSVSDKPKVIVKLPDEPLNKWIEFDEDGLHYRIRLTDNILVEAPDGTLEVNVYGEYCKVIAHVSQYKSKYVTKHLKMQSDLLLVKDIDKVADKEVDKIVCKCREVFMYKSVNAYKPMTIVPMLKYSEC